MAPVTEIARARVRPGVTHSSFEASASLAKGQPGLRAFRTGHQHEDELQFWWFVDWDSVDSHRAFQGRPEYAGMGDDIDAHVDGPAVLYHAELDSSPVAVLSHGQPDSRTAVAEVVHAYFPTDLSAEDQAAVVGNVQAFGDQMSPDVAPGYSGQNAQGWVQEELDFQGEKSKALVMILGWDSVESHMKFRDSEPFQRLIPLLRNLPRARGLEMGHVTTKVW